MKKIVFLTGTRADFGHQKSLIDKCKSQGYEVFIFITGTHLDDRYGETIKEIDSYGYDKYFAYPNHQDDDCHRIELMDERLAKTIQGFSLYVRDIKPDLVVIFADRFEALAGAIVGSLNNILTVHVQAGDASGTIDDSIRHAISKLCHAHFVANRDAGDRLISMGEVEQNIFPIGTPGIDVLFSEELPSLEDVKRMYDIEFDKYSIFVFHPVTTEFDDLSRQIDNVIDAVLKSGLNYIAILPNSDMGSDKVLRGYDRLRGEKNIKIFYSVEHSDFLTLLKNAEFIVGNSSCGVIEAPCYKVPTINIGSRQNNRTINKEIVNCRCEQEEISRAINRMENYEVEKNTYFGDGHSADSFVEVLNRKQFWEIAKQKRFNLCM